MKLTFDFSKLEAIAAKIGADEIDFQLDEIKPYDPIDIKLSTDGIEVDLEKIELVDGVFSYEGRHVVLYIADHSFKMSDAEFNKEYRNKFHITDCSTLQAKKKDNTFQRYVATNKLDGYFRIHGENNRTGKEVTLDVCMNCLNKTNYKGARDKYKREKIKREFNMEEFFASYKASFAKMPSGMGADSSNTNYSDDWDQISKKYRGLQIYCCEICKVNLSEPKYHKLLHVHHKDHLKGNNDRANLQALCELCHCKQHNHMRISSEKKYTIDYLRNQQRLL